MAIRPNIPKLGPLRRPLHALRLQLPQLNFITLHYLYFIITCLLSALIFWGSSTPLRGVNFKDSLFLCVSAMTEAGLNTVNLSELNTFQQFILFVLIMLGSAIWVSAFVVYVRMKAFEKEFLAIRSTTEKRGRPSFRRVRSWASGSSRRSNRDPVPDEEGGMEKDGDDRQENGNIAKPADSEVTLDVDGTNEQDKDGDDTRAMNGTTPESDDLNGSPSKSNTLETTASNSSRKPHIAFASTTRPSKPSQPTQPTLRRQNSRLSNLLAINGVGARPMTSLRTSTSRPTSIASGLPFLPPLESNLTRAQLKSQPGIDKYFESATGWIARNSQFHGLTLEQREKLGGCEYRAVCLLAWLVPVYFVLWQLLGALGCAAWVAYNAPNVARENGLNPWWVGAFNAVSAFNNSGMSLLDANMVAFQRSYYLLITMSLLILAGNTMFSVFLRMIVWVFLKIAERFARDKREEDDHWHQRVSTLEFLLEHPRRCYTNLFPSQHTWFLAGAVLLLNGFDWAMFEILNIGNHMLDKGLPTRYRVIDGLFQAFAVRAGGFYVVAIPTLRISLQVLYVVMMYISAYPVVITIRNSNVYEERSLGIYDEGKDDDEDEEEGGGGGGGSGVGDGGKGDEKGSGEDEPSLSPNKPFGLLKRAKTMGHALTASRPKTSETNSHFVRHQLRAQLAHDAWWLVVALFLIMIVEASHFSAHPDEYSVFNFIFEIVSAYGTVGISVGVPNEAYSFCGAWHPLSQLILCAVMLRGRHRGLPVAIDKAVLLPSEEHARAEEEDGRIKVAKRVGMSMEREREREIGDEEGV